MINRTRRAAVFAVAIILCVRVGTAGHTAGAQSKAPSRLFSRGTPPNILLIIGDDMGVETLRSYGVGADPAATPTLDRLAASGVRFNRFWSQPVCSPTRATLLTGRYGFRTGVGRPTGDGDDAGSLPPTPPKPEGSPREGRGGPPGNETSANLQGGRGGRGGQVQSDVVRSDAGGTERSNLGAPGLSLDEFTLPKAFAAHPELGYATAAVGKWHLADRTNGWAQHPTLAGFSYFAGLVRGFPEGYFSWIKDVNGALAGATGYAPTDNMDDAVRWISARGDKPWLMWYAFNLPHEPLHLPPQSLWVTDHSNLDPGADPDANPRPYFKAMLEAMDTEIGRLLDSLDPIVRANTFVVFMGDNGSSRKTVTQPFAADRAKGTVYEGGIRVPLIVSGPGTAKGRSSDALVNSVDMFSTIMEMAGIAPKTTVPLGITVDSVSFMPYLARPDRASVRRWIYADSFSAQEGVDGGQFAIRDRSYKLVVRAGVHEFFDLGRDPFESRNLLRPGPLSREQREAYEALVAQVTALHAQGQR